MRPPRYRISHPAAVRPRSRRWPPGALGRRRLLVVAATTREDLDHERDHVGAATATVLTDCPWAPRRVPRVMVLAHDSSSAKSRRWPGCDQVLRRAPSRTCAHLRARASGIIGSAPGLGPGHGGEPLSKSATGPTGSALLDGSMASEAWRPDRRRTADRRHPQHPCLGASRRIANRVSQWKSDASKARRCVSVSRAPVSRSVGDPLITSFTRHPRERPARPARPARSPRPRQVWDCARARAAAARA